ncbi:hypothetical protein EDD85DRAFT_441576 [Armillaria nabsnona]|nr:hypothetical protein EDD85DRAFT_441576 [Armillaria nabsnona]
MASQLNSQLLGCGNIAFCLRPRRVVANHKQPDLCSVTEYKGKDAVWALNEPYLPRAMSFASKPRSKPKKHVHDGSARMRSTAIQVANIIGEAGGMVPIVGPCVEGVAKAAKLLLESLEQFKNNREDMQDLAEDIKDIVIIIRDAGIEISDTPESIKYAEGLQNTCLKFEKFLCDLSSQVNETNRRKGGVLGNIVEFLNHRNVKESISRHRKLVEKARANFQSQVMLDSALVLLRNSASISHLSEQISSVQSILLTLSQANNENTVNDEMQIARQYRMPGGIDLVGGFQ